ncbi:metal/formaldehyde-sensitive transcriptional repressor [Martelella alba]|uniref:Metal/formaldehyde-sensitive transcriptional repressor n=1 Tax=Martelella alba TaxID=2590451 RepID=A0A506UE39_9HYPH|nr:metal/formaldehyde-sensitive transcriptional repressor [Martelella alba]TPW30949.1 metal/formaldehyde-sensitive transcriptional repressor [Martelella alba]
MTHTQHNKAKLLARVRRLKGQIEAVERHLEGGAPCVDILNLVASVRGAANGLTLELIEDHMREHVIAPMSPGNEQSAAGADELMDVIRRYLK